MTSNPSTEYYIDISWHYLYKKFVWLTKRPKMNGRRGLRGNYHFMAGLQFDWLGFRNNIFYSLVESSPVKLETSHTAYSDISPLYVNDLWSMTYLLNSRFKTCSTSISRAESLRSCHLLQSSTQIWPLSDQPLAMSLREFSGVQSR